ncbi:MAG: hypothetical protein HC898_07905 [Phycisphaerales bacterium]|nr:hypothetical protein [Phycisphaerales bacterium]
MNLTQSTLTEIRDALVARKLSSVEITRAYLDRIELLGTPLNAYHQVLTDRALDSRQAGR